MCIKKLCYSTETFLRYNVQMEKQVEKYTWYLHHELVLFLQSRIFFRCVQDNDIEGDILGWTTSIASLYTFLPSSTPSIYAFASTYAARTLYVCIVIDVAPPLPPLLIHK